MPKHTSVNTKAVEALQRRKEQKELAAQKKEEEMLNKYWEDNDKLAKAKQERKVEQQRKHQEKMEKKAELKKLVEKEEAEIVSNKKAVKGPTAVQKVTRAECLRNQILQLQKEKEEIKEEEYLTLDDGEVMANANHEIINEQIRLLEKNIDLIEASGIDDVLSSLTMDVKERKSLKTAYMGFQERTMAELKQEYPNLKLSQYKDMVYKLWKKSPENPFNAT